MFKKNISYVDYNGDSSIEVAYFHLTPAEMLDMEFEVEGGFSNYLNTIIESNNVREIIDTFKTIIKKSYGKKSEDGKRFIKNKEILDEFLQTEAYSELFMELATNTDSAVEFINALLPKDVIDKYVTENVELNGSN